MKICSHCEAINADGAQFCSKCGTQLGASIHGGQKSNYQPRQPYHPQSGGGYQPQQGGGYQPQQGGGYQSQQGGGYQPQQGGGYQSQQGGGYQSQRGGGYQPQQGGGYRPEYQPQPQPQPTYGTMGFGDAIRVCLKEKYASFEGRAKRAEYWYFQLFMLLVMIGATIVAAMLGALLSGGSGDFAAGLSFILVVDGILSLGFICPTISVLVRRLHDTGRSGWWYWICLIPYIGSIVLFIFTLLSSQEYDNEYGPYVRY